MSKFRKETQITKKISVVTTRVPIDEKKPFFPYFKSEIINGKDSLRTINQLFVRIRCSGSCKIS